MRTSPQLGFVAGLAAHQALSALHPFADRLQLKWPNDLLLDGAKLSGQLLEGRSLLLGLCTCFDRLLAVWNRGQGFATIRQQWLAYAAYLDKPIEIRTERGAVSGRFAGLDADGRLLLHRQGAGQDLTTIEAGDFYPLDLAGQDRS